MLNNWQPLFKTYNLCATNGGAWEVPRLRSPPWMEVCHDKLDLVVAGMTFVFFWVVGDKICDVEMLCIYWLRTLGPVSGYGVTGVIL